MECWEWGSGLNWDEKDGAGRKAVEATQWHSGRRILD